MLCGAAFHFHSEWICTQPEAVRREMRRRGERDKRQGVWGGWTVWGRLSFCDEVWDICILALCVWMHMCVCVCVCERDSIFQPWPPRSPFTQTLLLIAHPNSLQPVAHDKTTEQNQISKQHCITVPRYHTECWLLKPRETKCRYSAAYREIYSPVANLRNLWRRRPRAWAHSVVENITRPIKKYKKQLRFY